MKIAIPVADGKLCAHFGHCQNFTVIEVDSESNKIINKTELTPPAHEPGVLPQWLSEKGVTLIIASGMGMRAQQFFNQFNIKVIVGANPDTPDKIVADFLSGILTTGDNICDH
ncbi:MAG: NifB/NifX family molybdenum-iron cluster-binding protein [candidate division Zixibacteria bacterium]|nr:NifB/NifX family molybdenum-iron cluster-binding protein [candidate division Zixibacteria bacterium]